MTTKQPQPITVTAADAGQRLDHLLVKHLVEFSRSKLQQLIASGAVQVNQQSSKKQYRVAAGDLITVTLPDTVQSTGVITPLDILFEDDAIIVLQKPIGLIVHPAGKSHEPTLVDALLQHNPGIAAVGDSPERPGIMHRLDRLVSGIMVVAKTPDSFANLKQQFQNHTIYKEYRAIVHGVPEQTGVIKFVIHRSSTNPGRMAARPESAVGKTAWTTYERLRVKADRYAELKVVIKTGRTHQIRAHLAAIDHPVVGDTLYTSKKYQSKRDYTRLFLHAYALRFLHPISGQEQTYIAQIPEEFGQFLED